MLCHRNFIEIVGVVYRHLGKCVEPYICRRPLMMDTHQLESRKRKIVTSTQQEMGKDRKRLGLSCLGRGSVLLLGSRVLVWEV